ncbi:cysteine repeat modular protein 4 PbCRM4 [Plasmodium falciparum RAJ116]|uniref:Cysteine repeat modular protein 4 PbCRM4 n=1 Tax=Plasmodium falciparum RAJ116 TaxID=580058 RepID=A0A0L0CS00_PLAFA|nr:cysteine repeat modular protein 4 PbCRM4 [Plasmodium falciparum RAJ116]
MIYKGYMKNITFLVSFLIFLRSINANISITNFTYTNQKGDIKVEFFQTDYIAIFKLPFGGSHEQIFEISDDYIITNDKETNNCNIPNNNFGFVYSKSNSQNKFLIVQREYTTIYIKDKNNNCSLISKVEPSLYSFQTIEYKKEKIKLGTTTKCDEKMVEKLKIYIDLLNDMNLSEDKVCNQIIASSFIQNIEIIDCTVYIGSIFLRNNLNREEYYICIKKEDNNNKMKNNISLLINTIDLNNTLIMNTFYCNMERDICSIIINSIYFNNIPNITDDTLVLKAQCNIDSNPLINIDHVLREGYYTFHFRNPKIYFLQICIIDNLKKYRMLGKIYFLKAYEPIICFIGTPCVIKSFTVKENVQYVQNNIDNETFIFTNKKCDNENVNENMNMIETDYDMKELENHQHFYLFSKNPLTDEKYLCTSNNKKFLLLFNIVLIKLPEYNIHYSIINNVVINYSTLFFEYNNYLGPYVKYECSDKSIVPDEYNNFNNNKDNNFLLKNEELNFTIKFKAIIMRLCLKQNNYYYDIGKIYIENFINYKKISSLKDFIFNADVSLHADDINTKLLKFAIKEDHNCHSDQGFFVQSKDNFRADKKPFYKNIFINHTTVYESINQIILDKDIYYICMCSLHEKCYDNNNLIDYNVYTNISIQNEIQPLQNKKKFICKIFADCSFTINFENEYNNTSDIWVAKKGQSCNSKDIQVGIHVSHQNVKEINKEKINVTKVNFKIYYLISHIHYSYLFNKDIFICGNYRNQHFIVHIKSDFFLLYYALPFEEEINIKNVTQTNVATNTYEAQEKNINIQSFENVKQKFKRLFIYSYRDDAKSNLYKTMNINQDENQISNTIKFEIPNDHPTKYNEIYFINECHYDQGVIIYDHKRESNNIAINNDNNNNNNNHIIKSKELYWARKKRIYNKKLKKKENKNEIINIYNCSNEIMNNHTLTSILIFDGPLKPLDIYCYMELDCIHKENFSILNFDYSLFVEISDTQRIIIHIKESEGNNKEKLNKAEKIYFNDSKRTTELILSIPKHISKGLEPGPYKIIYTRKFKQFIHELYVGTFHFIGAPSQKYHLIRENQENIIIHGYFKNIENERIHILKHQNTCVLTNKDKNKKLLKSSEIEYILNEIKTNIQNCTYLDDTKLLCKNDLPVEGKFILCWCYNILNDQNNLCHNLNIYRPKITEVSSLLYSIDPILEISKSSLTNFLNYNIGDFFFIIDDDCKISKILN